MECRSNGEIDLPCLSKPQEPLKSYVTGGTVESRHYLKNIRKYNSCFQMTSFGASKIVTDLGFKPTLNHNSYKFTFWVTMIKKLTRGVQLLLELNEK